MIPINIAITGHRDLRPDKIPEYENGIRTVIKKIMQKYPNTTVQILTGMAEGADMLEESLSLNDKSKYKESI